MAIPVDRSFNAAQALLDAVVAHYATVAVDLPERQYVTDGTPAWDCEQLTVQMERTFNGLPDQPTVAPLDCLLVRTAIFVIELVRCIPVVEDELGNAVVPAADEISASARRILGDQALIVNAVVGAQRAGELAGCRGLTIVDWENAEPQGGLGGGRQRIYWQLTEGP